MTATLITLECVYCLTDFTPAQHEGTIEGDYRDAAEKICCDGCYCRICGHGHPTADGHEDCAAELEAGEVEPVDPDIATEIARDREMGL